jgi:hypothetical protein
MKTKVFGISLLMVALAVLWFRMRGPSTPGQSPSLIPPHRAVTVAAPRSARSTNIVIQTGQERMSNALRCMAFITALADKLPEERRADKPFLRSYAGILYFDDCLMSKISNGFITTTTNELRESFSKAIAQMTSSNSPKEVIEGFNHAINNRDNIHVSLDQQYQSMMQYPAMAKSLNELDKAIQAAGVTDLPQSDLKEMAIALCSTKTTAYLTYGPNDPDYLALADGFDQIFQWRVTNMYGLDGATAQKLSHSVLRVPVDAFSQAGAQPPAFIQ